MAMKAGKPVYVEKPLASTYDDCARINYVSKQTGIPCFVAYYRRYLPYFQRVKSIVDEQLIGMPVNVQVRFAVPPRDLDYTHPERLPWRLQPTISGGGYFYDLAPHQLDLLQHIFGVITEAQGICANRGGLYSAEDSVSAVFQFENGMPGSGSWSFVAHESARTDRILIVGTEGSMAFSVFNYDPIELHTSQGTELIEVPNPPYVQFPLIKSMIRHLQGLDVCNCSSVSATPTNWALDRILGKL
jgi:predicted dehydrogenase